MSSKEKQSADGLVTEEAEDHEIFDINDFTTASDWERFIVQIEELVNEWKLNANNNDGLLEDKTNLDDVNFENGEWKEKAETIQFAEEISFTLTYYYLSKKNSIEEQSNRKTNDQSAKRTETELKTTNDFESIYLTQTETLSSLKNKQTNRDMDADGDSAPFVASSATSSKLINLPPKSMADLLNKTNDFQTTSSSQIPTPFLAYWFGVCKFVVITPTRSNMYIDTESRAKVVLSSLSVAINNTGCTIPMFVQINAPQRDMYLGLCEGSALKTYFQIVHFNYTPQQYAYLPGLLEVYKSKLGNHLANTSLLISVSIRFTYLIQESVFLDWQQSSAKMPLNYESRSFQEIELIDVKNNEDIYPDIKNLPLGSLQDCVDSMYLSCVWSNLSEDLIVDSESFTDLNPQQSNDWSITLNNLLDKCSLQLTSLLYKFNDELKRTITVNQLLGNASSGSLLADADDAIKRAPLEKLAAGGSHSRRLDQMVNLSSNIVEKATNKMKILNVNDALLPLDKGFLDFIMDYLFPDAHLMKSKQPEQTSFKKETNDSSSMDPNLVVFLKRLNLMKSSSGDNNGLLNRLATCVCLVNQIGQTRGVAQLWREFLLELRYRYDSSILINGLNGTSPNESTKSSSAALTSNQADSNLIPPDLSRCLLHQKLQMLNCCIRKKVDRQLMETTGRFDLNEKIEPDNDLQEEDDEDEFFDCDENDFNERADEKAAKKNQSVPGAPEGRLRKCVNLTLLKKPDEPLYIPITQESTPMTEDMLEQHASVLVNLGSSDDAALLRAKIQSASLLSDMQSFKAANPYCVLEDFVRWYSPRDWVEIEEKIIDPETNEEKLVKRYDLSNRMKIPGNMWIEVWENAKPIPVRRQKRLFDDTKEAENIFDWFNSLSIGQIIEHLHPVMYYSAVVTCFKEINKLGLNQLADPIFELLTDKLIKISRNNETKKYQDLNNHIKTLEQIISLAESLNVKFFVDKIKLNDQTEKELKDFLRNLIKSSLSRDSCELKIENGAHGPIGKLITKLCAKKSTKTAKTNNQQTSYEYKPLNEKRDIHSNSAEQTNNDLTADDDVDELESENRSESDKLLPLERPFKREYILRSSVPRPAPYSRQSPQRMYCLMSNIEFRLAAAFTEDTMFF